MSGGDVVMANERTPDEQPVLAVEECTSVGHPLTEDVLGGMSHAPG